jgi:hypothetical protein
MRPIGPARASVTVAPDQPLLIVPPADLPQDLDQLRERSKGSVSYQILFRGADGPLPDTTPLGLPHEM